MAAEIDALVRHGREPARMELRCANCGDGLGYDQKTCDTCGFPNPRYAAELTMAATA